MANNRLYIRCKQCGKVIFIGKHFNGPLYSSNFTVDKLNDFYSEHYYCGNYPYALELCEEFPGEITDNNIDCDGSVVWF